MFGVKVVPIDVINHPLQYGGKMLGHPVYNRGKVLESTRENSKILSCFVLWEIGGGGWRLGLNFLGFQIEEKFWVAKF